MLLKSIKEGDQVIFEKSQIEFFKNETNGDTKEIKQYQQLVLGGIDQVGVIKEFGEDLTSVSYPDGWVLPIPTKYLVLAQ